VSAAAFARETSPQALHVERKNKPAGSRTANGNVVKKKSVHSNKGRPGPHQKTNSSDDYSLKAIMKSYPTSAEFHNTHGDLVLFTNGLYPVERSLIKYFLAQLNNGSRKLTEAIMVANAKEWKKVLHKVDYFKLYHFACLR
jgi:hypothetical protein